MEKLYKIKAEKILSYDTGKILCLLRRLSMSFYVNSPYGSDST
ncbi:hypothetical protein DORFOR_01804 [Dorea formicigenerans ATCC 27755]|uniref:Uncharacterized protein n=1 Tax=Dorea formicigenerans ATCC 27755 TaxID=411461 RepID=B0G773_9FIRM|nr:hypothetical protein DORFOR_01804 [Dorea formicigenerans ATCC 27755]